MIWYSFQLKWFCFHSINFLNGIWYNQFVGTVTSQCVTGHETSDSLMVACLENMHEKSSYPNNMSVCYIPSATKSIYAEIIIWLPWLDYLEKNFFFFSNASFKQTNWSLQYFTEKNLQIPAINENLLLIPNIKNFFLQ